MQPSKLEHAEGCLRERVPGWRLLNPTRAEGERPLVFFFLIYYNIYFDSVRSV